MDSFIYVIRLIHTWDMNLKRATWLIHMCDVTRSCATWLIRMCGVTRSYVRHDSHVRRDPSYVRQDTVTCPQSVTRNTILSPWRLCETWHQPIHLSRHVTHPYARDDSSEFVGPQFVTSMRNTTSSQSSAQQDLSICAMRLITFCDTTRKFPPIFFLDIVIHWSTRHTSFTGKEIKKLRKDRNEMCEVLGRGCWYGLASVRRIDKSIGLFCKRALYKRRYSAKETYNLIDPSERNEMYEVLGRGCRCCFAWDTTRWYALVCYMTRWCAIPVRQFSFICIYMYIYIYVDIYICIYV